MTRHPMHPWAPIRRPKACLDHDLDGLARSSFARLAEPAPGCDCVWCVQAATPMQPHTLAPACDCELCAAHLLHRRPPHYLRVCSHGERWTPYQGEPDDCVECLVAADLRQCGAMLYEVRLRGVA
jgi:hypothetical protein